MQTNKQTIFIIDDEPAVCDSLQWLFESIQFQVETYRTASSFQQNYDPKNAGLLITDVRLPDISGLELLEKLKQQKIFLPVIVITGYGDIPMAVRAMKLGAKDFLLKPFNEQVLLEKVQKHINQSVNNESLHLLNKRINSLSKREQQIIKLIIDGKLNKQIAHELSISISTVEAHRSNIMNKVQAKNLAQLIKLYLQAQQDYESV
ncbi:response regulator transcription factor (plasmid) [Legionella lytica]|uniref:Response regulator transcription factor n=1 Tax=Legionella lytica TaxID=96232 RepID=A0ABY4YD34_9GAMM|nr:response regulator [Legionella lytica]USQ15351.1 response regulator transcription factor [Legionella lytica]